MQLVNKIKSFVLYAGALLAPAALSAQGIYISPGAQLVMSGTPQLVLNNAGFTNNGTFAAGNSIFWFTGSTTSLTGFIDGSGTSTFYRMAIVKPPGSSVQVRQNIGISNMLYMISGNMYLDAHYLSLSGNIAGESENSYITSNNGGYISVARLQTTPPANLNPGNMGIEITSSTSPGIILVTRSHASVTLPNGSHSIKRSFKILATGLNATTLRFHYLDAELTGNSETALTLYKDSAGVWVEGGKDGIDTVNNTITKTVWFNSSSITLGPTSRDPILVTNPVARQAITSAENESILNKMEVYPVPAHNYFIITATSDRKRQSEFILFDEMGHLLQRKKVFLVPGSNNISWDFSSYPAGVYFMASDLRKTNKIRIVKQ